MTHTKQPRPTPQISVFAVCLALGLSACAPSAPAQSGSAQAPIPYPGTLREPRALGIDVQWRQRITATWPQGTRTFDAVLSKEGNTLQLIGLSPLGMPGFVLRLDGQELRVENNTSQEIPFEPRYVLLDVERVFFPWFSGAKAPDGARQIQSDGEDVRELWQAGMLSERRFKRLDNAPPGEIVVSYSQWHAGADAPMRAELVNAWFGYKLTIETLEQQRLP